MWILVIFKTEITLKVTKHELLVFSFLDDFHQLLVYCDLISFTLR